MCDAHLEPAQVWRERWRTARKGHACYACHEPINPGDRYHFTSWVFDGSAGSYKHCARCWAMYEAICAAHDAQPGAYSDAWEHVDLALNCGTVWEDELGELPADVAALAFALPGDFQAEATR